MDCFVAYAPRNDEAEIANRVSEFGGAWPCYCAKSASSALTGIGPFKNLEVFTRPSSLENAFKGPNNGANKPGDSPLSAMAPQAPERCAI